jgi:hypothetical protein
MEIPLMIGNPLSWPGVLNYLLELALPNHRSSESFSSSPYLCVRPRSAAFSVSDP